MLAALQSTTVDAVCHEFVFVAESRALSEKIAGQYSLTSKSAFINRIFRVQYLDGDQ